MTRFAQLTGVDMLLRLSTGIVAVMAFDASLRSNHLMRPAVRFGPGRGVVAGSAIIGTARMRGGFAVRFVAIVTADTGGHDDAVVHIRIR